MTVAGTQTATVFIFAYSIAIIRKIWYHIDLYMVKNAALKVASIQEE